MPITEFVCPDGVRIDTEDCLKKCRMPDRCASRRTLQGCLYQRKWNGKPSVTQCLGGTMEEFLKLTKDYAVKPSSRVKMMLGSKVHKALEQVADPHTISEERMRGIDGISGIADALEEEHDKVKLIDTKTGGVYAAVKALGLYKEEADAKTKEGS